MLRSLIPLVLSVLLTSPVLAADPNQPHSNQGLIAPITGKPVAVTLSETERALLESGKPVQKAIESDGGGRGVAIQLIDAPTSAVWDAISSFDKYPQWVDGVAGCSVYKRDGAHVYVKFDLAVSFIKKTYFINHTFRKSQGYVTWTLDYDRLSDFDDSVGYWLVVDEGNGKTRVEYSVDLRLSGVPDFLRKFLTKDALTDATSWVKKVSES